MTDASSDRFASGTLHFGRWLAAIVAAAFALRVAYTVGQTAPHDRSLYDSIYYLVQSQAVVRGDGFARPFAMLPNADHPPLTTLVITPATWLFGVTADTVAQRLTMSIVGTGAVAAIGMLGRAVRGPQVGLFAAGIAAVYPNLFMNDGIVMAESLAALTVALGLWAAYRLRATRSIRAAIALGVCCGFAALARAELLLLAPALAVPMMLGANRAAWREWIRPVLAVGAVTALVVAPWVVRNMVVFEEPALMGTGDGLVLLGANCDRVYGGERIGSWGIECTGAAPLKADAAVLSRRQRDQAFDYIEDHLGRVPAVVAARVGRVWGVFRPVQTVRFSELEGRPHTPAIAGLVMYWILAGLAVGGIVVLRRGRALVWPLLVPVALVTMIAAFAYGTIRFRVPAEVSIVVLAAVALDAVWKRRRGEPDARPADQASAIEASSSS
ncbi:MAG TPA: glycosyltransferase family 39 protein [Acidimicrobiia bacterium]|nr:glycosyltransferase family 39 protein [Acidimicrobiia bacterium]